MTETEAIDLIRRYCEGRMPPAEFERRFYAEDSCMGRLLSDETKQWYPPLKGRPYVALVDLDLDLVGDAKRARDVLRAFLDQSGQEPAPVTPQLLDDVERRLGVRLPAAYRKFVTENDPRNFGPRTIAVPTPIPDELQQYFEDGRWTVDALLGPVLDEEDASSILKTIAMREEWNLPAGLVLLDGDGHTWTALEYRMSTNEPRVVFVESDEGRTHVLAESFGEFLTKASSEE